MRSGNQDYDQLDETQLIFRQIDRINRAVTGDLESLVSSNGPGGTMDPSTYSHRVQQGVRFLGSMLEPILTEEKKQKIQQEVDEYLQEKEPGNPWTRVSVAEKRFKHYIQTLQEHNMAFHESDSFVIDKPDEEKERSEAPGLEDSDSQVTEEVVE